MKANEDAGKDTSRLHRGRVLTHTFGVLAAVAIALSSMGVSAAPKGPPVWRDEFNAGDLDPAWYWVNENPSGWSLSERDGFMRVNSPPYPTGGENLLLRTGAEGNFTIETYVEFEPTANWQFAGLVIYQDEDDYVQFGRSFCDLPELPEVCPFFGNGIYFDNVENNEWGRGNFATQTTEMDAAYLRLEVKGRKVAAFYSGDGQAWQKIGQHQLRPQFKINGVGLTASQDYWSGQNPPAYFDYFAFTGNPKLSSPFVGHWLAVDGDGSDLRLTIGGPPLGPFQLTETDSYITYCDGEAGIAKGTGQLDDSSPYLLEAHLTLECFTTDAADRLMDVIWRYDPVSDTISQTDDSGLTTRWHRPGNPPPPPTWTIVARPADEAVDGGNFEPGTVVGLYVTSSEGAFGWYGTTVAEVPDWDPGNGWAQFNLGFDGYDLKATDHLWMTDGVNARELVVTPLEITDADLSSMTLGGRAEAGSQVFVDLPPDHTEVTTDQDGEWRVPFDVSHLGQVATAYQVDSDGDYTLAGWGIPAPRIVASEVGDWFWTTEFPPSAELIWEVSVEDDRCNPPAVCQGAATSDDSGFIHVGLELDLLPGDVLSVSAGSLQKVLQLERIRIHTFDMDQGIMAGTAPLNRDVKAVASPSPEGSDQLTIDTKSDENGNWAADFGTSFTDEWRPWSFAQIFDGDGDANEVGPPPAIKLRVNYGHDWVESFYPAGHEVIVTVTESDGGAVKATATVITEAKVFWDWNTGFQTVAEDWDQGPPDIQPGDRVSAIVDNGATAQVQIGDIRGSIAAADTISGTIDASWITDPIRVECLDWFSGTGSFNKEVGEIRPNGIDHYACSWASEFDIPAGQTIGVGYFDRYGNWVANAFPVEDWVWVFEYYRPAGVWAVGDHTYYFEMAYTVPEPGGGGRTDPVSFTVDPVAPPYDGKVLLRPWFLRARTSEACVGAIDPVIREDQETRFVWGWATDWPMTYEDALAQYQSMRVWVGWDEGPAVETVGHGIVLGSQYGDLMCSMTE